MSNELLVSHTTGTTVYAAMRVPINRNHADGGNIGTWWNFTVGVLQLPSTAGGAPFEEFTSALAELGNTGLFEGDIPEGLNPEKALEVIYWEQAGAAPAETDTKITGSNFEFLDEWVAVSSLRV